MDHTESLISNQNISTNNGEIYKKSYDNKFDIVERYETILEEDPNITMPIAAIQALVDLVRHTKANTLSEFTKILQEGSLILKSSVANYISVSAGCDLFLRFVTRSLNDADVESCKHHLVSNGKLFVERARKSRDKIASIGVKFIRDGIVILVHSYSRNVNALLLEAASKNIRFSVYITESRPTGSGIITSRILSEAGIPTAIVLDSAVGYLIQKIDLVLVGAEGIVENGGLINHIGTSQIATLAKIANKPFYAVAESHKFVRMFLLSQYDLPTPTPILQFLNQKFPSVPKLNSRQSSLSIHRINELKMTEDEICNNPILDFTAPEYIDALITDLGILDPNGVSEELIKLYL
ncbi:translation initiation factor eIF2B subunit alpha [Pneumocystis jirovecii RU7]|uniref:Translation initiation factor eIF2B subunit alpha n=1 Tax=Pneumocystis jirovecii (strain RU7) TaxID=1408657 RepID=A0A0W4ZFH9_PNEJ7|nr:translation initiation factor eIF2B subunit alpha [Pneumocystis jirovecii RU7]KTW27120.1 hypothetical protein T551_03114 [Pneumocystis jirovecii RU7]